MSCQRVETGEFLAASLALEWSQALVQQHMTFAIVLPGEPDDRFRTPVVQALVRSLVVVRAQVPF